jgi:hypothetical protein
MHLLSTVLFYSTLVAAAPRVISETNSINQFTRRTTLLLDQTLARLSNDEAKVLVNEKSCYADRRVKWPQNDLPTPSVNEETRQLKVFTSPATSPNTLTVHNYCKYDIHYRREGQQGVLDSGILSAGTAYTTPLAGVGMVWKGSKSKDMGKVVLVEYSIDSTNVWYNLSLVKCLGVKDGLYTTDTSGCAGHEAGLQFGNKGNRSFQCAAGMWCDDQAYLYDVSHPCVNEMAVILMCLIRKTCARPSTLLLSVSLTWVLPWSFARRISHKRRAW